MRYTRRQLAQSGTFSDSLFHHNIESFPARCFVNVRVDIKMKGKENKKDSR
jgi:hypothetical protein